MYALPIAVAVLDPLKRRAPVASQDMLASGRIASATVDQLESEPALSKGKVKMSQGSATTPSHAEHFPYTSLVVVPTTICLFAYVAPSVIGAQVPPF